MEKILLVVLYPFGMGIPKNGNDLIFLVKKEISFGGVNLKKKKIGEKYASISIDL